MSQSSPRLECPRCLRPQLACYCAHVRPLPTRTRVLVLQHPRERDKAVGTARIAALCLPEAEVLVGVDFASNARLNALLADTQRPPVLLYPGPGARDVQREPPEGPVTLVVIDGTWHQARSLVRKNPQLDALPRYAFVPPRPSEYKIRREPQPDYVSTIEALAVTLAALERDGRNFEELLSPFRAMVSVQVDFASRSPLGRHRRNRRRDSLAAPRLPEQLCAPTLVCVAGEANAWPHDRALRRPPHAHELVHWVAERGPDHPAGPDAFEALLAPRAPLSKSPLVHARLTAEQLAAGLTLPAFRAAWQRFSRAEDVLCCWGHYGINLLQREGIALPEQVVDLRKVAGDYLKRRPGSLEELVETEQLDVTPRGHGRGGERLGMLVAVTRWLAGEAQRERAPVPSPVDVEPGERPGSEAQAELAVDE
ncbi:MAG TPA: tRNA-uridine aminocarboxypropyltransferase [Polyangiales bacterium]